MVGCNSVDEGCDNNKALGTYILLASSSAARMAGTRGRFLQSACQLSSTRDQTASESPREVTSTPGRGGRMPSVTSITTVASRCWCSNGMLPVNVWE